MSFVVELPLEQYRADAFAAFSPDASFSLGTARATAWLARLSYETDTTKIDTVLALWDLSRAAMFAGAAAGFLPVASTRGFAVHGHGATLITFTGTDPLELANWITDFDARLSPAGLHRGFEAAVDIVWPQVLDAFRQSGNRPVLLTGHSLGAALAVIAAERAADEGHLARAVYAFGMPRVGGMDFAERYPLGAVTYRLVHGDDIVPSVPPSELGFRHVGCLIRAPRGGVFEGMPLPAGSDEPLFVPSLVTGLKDALRNIGRDWPQPPAHAGSFAMISRFLPPRYGDHLPDRYCRAFKVD